MTEAVLAVEDLTVSFDGRSGPLNVVDGISFAMPKGACLGIVGESGSGKSMTALAIMRLVSSPPARISARKLTVAGRDILNMSNDEMRAIRGRDIAMIFQDPMSSLNPLMSVGDQIGEALMLHNVCPPRERRDRIVQLLELVGIPDPAKRIHALPHAFSGGMRQRVMIAMAISCNPKLLIADEPTTALDVTVQAQVLELMQKLRRTLDMSIIMISHDMGVISSVADRVLVMYGGRIVEQAEKSELFAAPVHPYTRGLLRSIPSKEGIGQRLYQIPGNVPSPADRPSGCSFYDRCECRLDICRTRPPELKARGGGREAACYFAEGVVS
jgi:peptide/nickel transport system ATP-binding protein